jgi:hypothetical protein
LSAIANGTKERKLKRTIRFCLIFLLVLVFANTGYSKGHKRIRKDSNSYENQYKTSGDVKVRGYLKKNGTYVQSHHKTKSNGTQRDNYSAEENLNPYTGTTGHKKVIK